MCQCEANCGSRIQVYGNKYCPGCYKKYSNASFKLDFRPVSETPKEDGTYLLMNPCDGYHVAEAMFRDDGGFDCFTLDFKQVVPSFYVAWAKLPDTVKEIHPIFVGGEK